MSDAYMQELASGGALAGVLRCDISIFYTCTLVDRSVQWFCILVYMIFNTCSMCNTNITLCMV